jgi:hypothetical protein
VGAAGVLAAGARGPPACWLQKRGALGSITLKRALTQRLILVPPPQTERLTRKEAAKLKAKQEAAESAAGGEAGADGAGAGSSGGAAAAEEEPEPVDSYEFAEPRDIIPSLKKVGGRRQQGQGRARESRCGCLACLPQCHAPPFDTLSERIPRPQDFWEGLAAPKWSDRKGALTQLKELASYPRLVCGSGRPEIRIPPCPSPACDAACPACCSPRDPLSTPNPGVPPALRRPRPTRPHSHHRRWTATLGT